MPNNSASSQNPYGFLSGNGEMALLTKQYDWAATPLGAIENWPQSLRTTLGIVLGSKFPMFLFWGTELTCFYNDAYRPSLGNNGKHPYALGKPGAEIWPEIWADIKPLIDQVLSGGEASWSEDQLLPIYRNGQMENVYWTFSYSPVFDESGKPGGVFVTCTETTKAVENLKTLEETKDQLLFAMEGADLATWDFNPMTNKFTANNLLKEWFGLPLQEEIELPHAISIIAEKDQQRVIEAIAEALRYESGGLYEIEYTIVHPVSKTERIVKAKGRTWFGEDKQPYRFNGIIQDVTEQSKAIEKIEKNEHLLNNVIQQAPVRISFLTGPEMKIELVNDAVLQSWGKDRSVIGMPLKNALPELKSQPFLNLLSKVYESGAPYAGIESEAWFDTQDTPFYFDIWYKPIFDNTGKVYGILTTAVDVTQKVNAQKQNVENEHRFRDVVESAPFPIGVYVGEEMRIQLANQTMLDTWGKGNDVIGKLYTEILPELEHSEIFTQVRGVLHTGVPFHAKNTRVDLLIDGQLQPFFFNYSFTPLYNSEGKIYGVMNTAADVTEGNLAKQMAEQSEGRFRSLIATAPVAIGVFLGRDLIIGTHNQTFIDIVGKSGDLLGKPLYEVMPELLTEGQPFLKILDDVYTTGKMFQAYGTQVKIVQDGVMTYNYYDITYTPLFDANDEVYGILDIAIDVTENVLAQQKIEESERSLRNTILQAPVAMCILKGDRHTIGIANERMLELWGANPDIIGKELLEGLPELIGQGFDLLLDHVYATGETYKAYDVSVNLPRANGIETVFVDFVYEAFRESDHSISGVLVVAIDVTEQVVARLKTEQAEESARLAIESADLGSYEINLQSDGMQTSDRFNEIWGVDRSESRAEFAKRIHPDDRAIREKAHAESLLTGNLHYEARVIHPDQSIVWIKIKGKVLYDDEGKPITLLGVIQDITEQKQFADELGRQVRQRTLELNRSNEDLLHFAHIASHDLKEPVRKIKVFSNMLEEQFGGYLPEKGKVYIDKVQHATDRMFSMIEGILTYSALNASDQAIEKIDLNEIIGSIETDLEVHIQHKNATITSDNLPVIEGASVLIYQLFYNLINNSLKFAKADVDSVITIHSTIIKSEGIDYAEISLADNGIGIEQEYAQQIFNAFTRLNAKDKYEGTGLGLALCKKITDRHHGSISATGIKNEGAVFTIMLPLKQVEKIV